MTLVLSVTTSSTAAPDSGGSQHVVTLSPDLFATLSTGIALIRTFNCGGTATGEGTGFLVGASVVMTARHVIRGSCRAKVLIDGVWRNVDSEASWYRTGRSDINAADVATLRIHGPADGHIFTIRSWSPAVGSSLAAIGHPLGNGISLTQGQVVYKGQLSGVPVLAVRLLGAEGSSGSPLVDNSGNVVGILQLGLGGKDILGQRTSGVVVGIDLPSWWPNVRRNLCRAYPAGGINGCTQPTPAPAPTPAPPPTPPSTTYHVQRCWVQYTGGSWSAVDPSQAVLTLSGADIASRGPANFWSVAQLDAPALDQIFGITVTLIEPNGTAFHTDDPWNWSVGSSQGAVTLDWYWLSDHSSFFQHPEVSGQGTWTLRWNFPDGEVCNNSFTVS